MHGEEIKTEMEQNFEHEASRRIEEHEDNESCEDILLDTLEEEKSNKDFSSRLQNNEFHLPVVVEKEPILNPKSSFLQRNSNQHFKCRCPAVLVTEAKTRNQSRKIFHFG